MRHWLLVILASVSGYGFSTACLQERSNVVSLPGREDLGTRLALVRSSTVRARALGSSLSRQIALWKSTPIADLPAHFDSLATLPNSYRFVIERIAISEWLARDTESAQAYFRPSHPRYAHFVTTFGQEVPDAEITEASPYIRSRLLMGLAKSDPQRCLNFMLEHQEALIARNCHQWVYQILAREAPHLAIQAAREIKSKRERASIFGTVAEHWAKVDPKAAFEWEVSEGRHVSRTVEAWAQSDPTSAAAGVESISNRDRRASASVQVFKHWAKLEPENAIAWLAKVSPASDYRSTAYRHAVSEVGMTDLDAAWELLNRLRADLEKPLDLSSLGAFWGANAPHIAAAAFENDQLARELVRTRFSEGLTKAWRAYDSVSAAAFEKRLESLTMNEEEAR